MLAWVWLRRDDPRARSHSPLGISSLAAMRDLVLPAIPHLTALGLGMSRLRRLLGLGLSLLPSLVVAMLEMLLPIVLLQGLVVGIEVLHRRSAMSTLLLSFVRVGVRTGCQLGPGSMSSKEGHEGQDEDEDAEGDQSRGHGARGGGVVER